MFIDYDNAKEFLESRAKAAKAIDTKEAEKLSWCAKIIEQSKDIIERFMDMYSIFENTFGKDKLREAIEGHKKEFSEKWLKEFKEGGV